MKKILIISYYWPPAGGASVQRWMKFVKYLPEFGWEPTIFVPENPTYPVLDESLVKEVEGVKVIRQKIWEPYGAYKKVANKKGEVVNSGFLDEKSGKLSFKEKASRFVRGNFFIPDARKYWVKPSIKRLSKELKETKFDAIVSSGPPHSVHLIGMALQKRFGIKWIADFRDPWTTMDYYQLMYITKLADRKHNRLEREVITKSDEAVVVGDYMRKEFEEKYHRKVHVLPTGYDPEKYKSANRKECSGKFSVVHVGSLLKNRNPKVLWQAIAEWKRENHEILNDFSVKLVGKVDKSAVEDIDRLGVSEYVELVGYVSHQEALDLQTSAPVLGLFIDRISNAEFVLSSKAFEYVGAQRPVLCIGPLNGDIKEVIKELKNSYLIDFDDVEGVKKAILELYEKHTSNQLEGGGGEKYSIENVTKELVALLEKK